MDQNEKTPLLSVKDLAISFGENRVLTSVSFDLRGFEALGVIGPNGAGKTVMLNILTGILKPSRGRIELCGNDVTRAGVSERANMGFGRTFQIPRSFENMTAYENILVGAVFGNGQSEKAAAAPAARILDEIGLGGRKRVFAGKLGLLDRKRLEIGIALAARPKVLLLDEAAGGLTESEVAEILAIVRRIKESGIGVIWIEHVLQTMMHGTDRVMLLAEGRSMVCGLPGEVMASREVEEVYLGVQCGRKRLDGN
ncbi:MAG: ATP-binding cassette domain-containing protein [Clostridiales Family XIII bacterium]|jgi:branched-chain amino acid transport system ATP-binding protein|nr:ATP-binding cassette domain-containing protein [Clostridiales Family XIII bacterium]